ncbi:hypothetical protein PVA17_01600 [Lysinibacillus sp. CNPSo 3705]|uniref:hypothetical protein n=1 Tax=Lysinibacillus sp. CNPSo 3705 TaxID=3028148 RepID=UPI002363C6A5|nr:hypothetical protein [Lysinibacillus sp. CNPSo 3705]MDD1501473.1 hypothetical protein [Lysinibacillus sp. CNPSo 3705]
MLNFKRYIYKGVGSRVKMTRERMGFNQVNFVGKLQEKYISIDRFQLSRIENGRIHKKKNPYLLTEDQMFGISELTGYEPKNLIFGNDKEREDTVKLILLAVIMNGAKYGTDENNKEIFINPFIDTRVTKEDREEVYKELRKNNTEEIAKEKSVELGRNSLEEFLRLSKDFIKNESADRIVYLFFHFNSIEEIDDEEIVEYIEWFRIKQPFFADTNHFESMKYLVNEPDIELEYPSNLLIKLLIGNNSFAQLFMGGLSQRSQYQIMYPNHFPKNCNLVENFINNYNQFGDLAIDFKNSGFTKFVKAFTEMWERNNEKFMDYFNENLFNINLSEQGLKQIDDEFIHSLITSNEFSKMLYDMIEVERYGMETMKGHNTFELYLQEMVIKNTIDFVSLPENDLFKYINNMIQTNNTQL